MNTRMQNFERNTLSEVMNSKRVWATHLVVNALLMVAFFYWARIPEATVRQFAFTVTLGLAIGLLTTWLHSATFNYFRPASERSLLSSLRNSLARIPAFLLWAAIFGIVLWYIGRLWDYEEQAGGYVHHLLPQFLRRIVTPQSLFSAVHWLTWFLFFFLWPILFLPVGAQVAVKNFRGFISAAAFRPIRELRFWTAYVVCFLIGAYLPYTLAWMVPQKPSSLFAQAVSMTVRLGFGYLLAVTAWVVLCAAIVRAGGETEGAAAA
jgi:hypothetical protein